VCQCMHNRPTLLLNSCRNFELHFLVGALFGSHGRAGRLLQYSASTQTVIACVSGCMHAVADLQTCSRLCSSAFPAAALPFFQTMSLINANKLRHPHCIAARRQRQQPSARLLIAERGDDDIAEQSNTRRRRRRLQRLASTGRSTHGRNGVRCHVQSHSIRGGGALLRSVGR